MSTTSKTGIAFISTFPPRPCGIATYTTDLIATIQGKFNASYNLMTIPLETRGMHYTYDNQSEYILETGDRQSYHLLADHLNSSKAIDIVCIQHEFGLFKEQEDMFSLFLKSIQKDIVLTFHTVLPNPDEKLRTQVYEMAQACKQVIVMTQGSAEILIATYQISPEKITIIAHGTHLAPASNKSDIRKKYGLVDKKVLSTFGLLGPGKNIETTLEALPAICAKNPDIIFLILGMTHPTLLQEEGEKYRNKLKDLVAKNKLTEHVQFINTFLSTKELLDYLLITDIYLFTSNDRYQAVSGTFAYAISSGCPIVSTPIPHVREVLKKDMGVIIDFEAPDQLAHAVNNILADPEKMEKIRQNNLQKMVVTSWQNVALAHVDLFRKIQKRSDHLQYTVPPINLEHIKRMTTEIGMLQFAQINTPDRSSGYTLDDNARALIALLHHHKISRSPEDLALIEIYLNFIAYCLQDDGMFLNYVDQDQKFTEQNDEVNLDDASGRAIWALGEVVGMKDVLPGHLSSLALQLIDRASVNFPRYYSTRAMAFIIKGLYFTDSAPYQMVMKIYADRLVAMFEHEATAQWRWFESYLTYGNSVLSEALIAVYQRTQEENYKKIAYQSFDFLLSKIFFNDEIHVISNKGWAQKDELIPKSTHGGEQPIDVAYTIMALHRFHQLDHNKQYQTMLKNAFDWFLGKNHLKQIVYNPTTGGCFDGVEESSININQGAESTVSYLMARLTMREYTD